MVVHGQNAAARNAMVFFLRALGLAPIEWDQAVAETSMGTPHNFEAVRAAMDVAQAVVVVLTAEERAGILPSLSGPDKDDELLRGQPRQNVIIEAGMAMGIDQGRTILVEVGPIRRASDFDGMNTVRMDNTAKKRASLRSRLVTAGCAVDESANDYLSASSGGDFDGSIIPWTATAVPEDQTSQWHEVPPEETEGWRTVE
jgi:predicted nucleotide-binding protein